MANTTVQIQMPSGLSSPTLTLYADGSDTAGNTPDTLTEPTNRKGLYQATVTEALDGMHFAKVLVGSNVVATGWVVLADDTNTYNVVDAYADASDLTVAGIADAVWDEAASAHNIAGSFGKFLRQLKEGVVSAEADVNDASATTTSFVTTLTETSDSHYSDLTCAFIGGNLTGQSRIISSYNGTTKTLTFDEAWSEAPADTDTFIILTTHIHTKSQIADAVWDEQLSGHTSAGSTGEALDNAGAHGITQQNIADALKLTPTAGSPAAGSVNADLDTLLARTGAGVTVTTSGAADSRGNINTPIKRGDSYGPSSGNAFVVNGSSFSSGVWGGGGVTATLKLKQGTTYKTTGTVAVSHDGDETITATISFTTAETTALVENLNTTYEIEFNVGSEQRTIFGKWPVSGSDE